MKTERTRHESTLPAWVRFYTGDGKGSHAMFRYFSSSGEKLESTLLHFMLAWVVSNIGLFLARFIYLLISTAHPEEMQWLDIGISSIVFIASPILATCGVGWWWWRRHEAIKWIRDEWEAITDTHLAVSDRPPDVNAAELLRACCADGNDHRWNNFHRLRDLLAWLGCCDSQFRPRDLKRISP